MRAGEWRWNSGERGIRWLQRSAKKPGRQLPVSSSVCCVLPAQERLSLTYRHGPAAWSHPEQFSVPTDTHIKRRATVQSYISSCTDAGSSSSCSSAGSSSEAQLLFDDKPLHAGLTVKHHPSTATVYGYMINGDAAYIYILPTEAAAVKQLMDSWSCCVNKTSIIPIVNINKTYKTLTDRWRFCYTHKFI